MYKYFSQLDFDNCNPRCKISDMHEYSMKKFDAARHIAGIAFVVLSAYRSPEWEIERNRTGNGSHTRGMALDIAALSGRDKFIIIRSLLYVGCNRLGIAASYIHADFDLSKDPSCLWLYH
jgi:hypothetical protein